MAAAALTLALAGSSAAHAAARHCGNPRATVTHTTTTTKARITSNPCHKWWIWAWGTFADGNGPHQHDGPGKQSGSSTAYDGNASANLLGGYKFSGPDGVIHTRQSY